jgi:hypothetical protein
MLPTSNIVSNVFYSITFIEEFMFQENTSHLQSEFFGVVNTLSESKQKKLENSREFYFYKLLFCNIEEHLFSDLFSDKGSRPNTPVNILVSSIILQKQYACSITDFINRVDFDILTRTALGLQDIEETPFCAATYYNFQNRLLAHYNKTGVNLVGTVFDSLTKAQLKQLGVKTNIQRMDSFQVLTNARSYGRIELLIEVLLRLYHTFEEQEKIEYKELLSPFLNQTSTKYIYDLNKSDFPKVIKDLANMYHTLYQNLKDDLLVNDEQHNSHPSYEQFAIFARVYEEHFIVVGDKIEVIDGKDLSSGNLQTPDDLEATYRNKNGEKNIGFAASVAETANPENEINLITDVAVAKNNSNDSTILTESLPEILEKTPDLEELHNDAAYGSSENDVLCKENNIIQVPTAVKGRKLEVPIIIEGIDNSENYKVSCPYQEVESTPTNSRHKACFTLDICAGCKQRDECSTQEMKQGRVHYFTDETALMNKRNRNILLIPEERRNIRPNVEATMKEFTKPFNHKGKIKVRGLFNATLFAITSAININFGRIYRYSMV